MKQEKTFDKETEEEKLKKIFSERFKKLLKEKGFTQTKYVEFSGISVGSVSKFINGESIPKKKTLEIIAKSLNVSSDYLLGKSDTPNYNFDSINKKTGLSQKAIVQLWKFQHDDFPFEENIDITEDKEISDFFRPHINILNLILEDSGNLFFILDNINKYKTEYEKLKQNEELAKSKENTNKLLELENQDENERLAFLKFRIQQDYLRFIDRIIEKGKDNK